MVHEQQRTGPRDRSTTAEIAKFEAMAADWWDPNGKFKPLHMLKPDAGWIT
jgi:2-polyprenyl-6-hydroxyphenyl methylase/3-demethylubiquinone-9 3-methyltransferase